jgi:hypothetical protein
VFPFQGVGGCNRALRREKLGRRRKLRTGAVYPHYYRKNHVGGDANLLFCKKYRCTRAANQYRVWVAWKVTEPSDELDVDMTPGKPAALVILSAVPERPRGGFAISPQKSRCVLEIIDRGWPCGLCSVDRTLPVSGQRTL